MDFRQILFNKLFIEREIDIAVIVHHLIPKTDNSINVNSGASGKKLSAETR